MDSPIGRVLRDAIALVISENLIIVEDSPKWTAPLLFAHGQRQGQSYRKSAAASQGCAKCRLAYNRTSKRAARAERPFHRGDLRALPTWSVHHHHLIVPATLDARANASLNTRTLPRARRLVASLRTIA